MIRERETPGISGWAMFWLLLGAGLFAAYSAFGAFRAGTPGFGVAFLLMGAACLVCMGGLFMVNPNEARVLQLYGDYRGTAHPKRGPTGSRR